MKRTEFQSVYVRVPLRLSLAGGGTDFPEYFESCDGTTITSVALGHFVHVHVRTLTELFDTKYRLEYYEVEHCNEINEIKNDIIRGVLKLMSWDSSVYISVVSDIPSSSGLGSSSAFAVGLILALTRMRDRKILSPHELCALAIEVELEILDRSMGIQDCLPAAFGGFKIFELETRYQFSASHEISLEYLEELVEKNCLAMIWTGGQRDSGTVLRDQKTQIKNQIDSYDRLKTSSLRFRDEIVSNSLVSKEFKDSLVKVLNCSQHEKEIVGVNAVTPTIRDLMSILESLGVKGQRLVGAGNGGFILAISDDPFIEMLKIHKLRFIQPKFSSSGAEITFEERK